MPKRQHSQSHERHSETPRHVLDIVFFTQFEGQGHKELAQKIGHQVANIFEEKGVYFSLIRLG